MACRFHVDLTCWGCAGNLTWRDLVHIIATGESKVVRENIANFTRPFLLRAPDSGAGLDLQLHLVQLLFATVVNIESFPRSCDTICNLTGEMFALGVPMTCKTHKPRVSLLHEIFSGIFSWTLLLPPKYRSKETKKAAFDLLLEMSSHFSCELVSLLADFENQCAQLSDWSIAPRQVLSQAGFSGLTDLGCTDYVNAVLQQLFHIPNFRRGILSIPGLDDSSGRDFLYQLQVLYTRLQYSLASHQDTKPFFSTLLDHTGTPLNPLIQIDADEFFVTLLDRLDSQLKPLPTHSHFISQIFGGVLRSQIISRSCPHVFDREEDFYSLSVDITGAHTLHEALSSMTSGEVLTGDNMFWCPKCERKVIAMKRIFPIKLPSILVFHLRRIIFDFDAMRRVKITDRLEFPLFLNMGPWSTEISQPLASESRPTLPPSTLNYELKGVINHCGVADSGHHYSLLKSNDDPKSWLELNDCLVAPFDIFDLPANCFGGVQQVMHQNRLVTVPAHTSACMLFYQQVSPPVQCTSNHSWENEGTQSLIANLAEENCRLSLKTHFTPDFLQFLWDFAQTLSTKCLASQWLANSFQCCFFLCSRADDRALFDKWVENLKRSLETDMRLPPILVTLFSESAIQRLLFQCKSGPTRSAAMELILLAISQILKQAPAWDTVLHSLLATMTSFIRSDDPDRVYFPEFFLIFFHYAKKGFHPKSELVSLLFISRCVELLTQPMSKLSRECDIAIIRTVTILVGSRSTRSCEGSPLRIPSHELSALANNALWTNFFRLGFALQEYLTPLCEAMCHEDQSLSEYFISLFSVVQTDPDALPTLDSIYPFILSFLNISDSLSSFRCQCLVAAYENLLKLHPWPPNDDDSNKKTHIGLLFNSGPPREFESQHVFPEKKNFEWTVDKDRGVATPRSQSQPPPPQTQQQSLESIFNEIASKRKQQQQQQQPNANETFRVTHYSKPQMSQSNVPTAALLSMTQQPVVLPTHPSSSSSSSASGSGFSATSAAPQRASLGAATRAPTPITATAVGPTPTQQIADAAMMHHTMGSFSAPKLPGAAVAHPAVAVTSSSNVGCATASVGVSASSRVNPPPQQQIPRNVVSRNVADSGVESATMRSSHVPLTQGTQVLQGGAVRQNQSQQLPGGGALQPCVQAQTRLSLPPAPMVPPPPPPITHTSAAAAILEIVKSQIQSQPSTSFKSTIEPPVSQQAPTQVPLPEQSSLKQAPVQTSKQAHTTQQSAAENHPHRSQPLTKEVPLLPKTQQLSARVEPCVRTQPLQSQQVSQPPPRPQLPTDNKLSKPAPTKDTRISEQVINIRKTTEAQTKQPEISEQTSLQVNESEYENGNDTEDEELDNDKGQSDHEAEILECGIDQPFKRATLATPTYPLKSELLNTRAGALETNETGQDKESQRITVFVRVRPPNPQEIQSGSSMTVEVIDANTLWFDREPAPEPSDPRAGLTSHRFKNKMFVFDRVFGASSTQEDVYRVATKGIIDSILDGFNATVFAYGATGSGKTHTMIGNPQYGPGVMGLAMRELFEKISTDKGHLCNVSVLCIEVYNEKIRDLFSRDSPPIALHESDKKVFLTGVTNKKPQTWEEVHEMLQLANKNRTQHPTDANAESSRSHAVFQIIVERKDVADQTVTSGKLSLIDLAGSERATSTMNRTERRKEGAAINKSLLALANCINALGNPKYRKGDHIPYRDSKLTRLLKDSLGGNCRTVMIANVSPASRSIEDSFNTLEYAKRTKEIKVQVSRTILAPKLSPRQYQMMVDDLSEQLRKAKLHSQHLEQRLEGSRMAKYEDPPRTSATDLLVKKLQDALAKCTSTNHQLTSSITTELSSWRTITATDPSSQSEDTSTIPSNDALLQVHQIYDVCTQLINQAQEQGMELCQLAEAAHSLSCQKPTLPLGLWDDLEKYYLSEICKQHLNCSTLAAVARYLLHTAKDHSWITFDLEKVILGMLTVSSSEELDFQPVKLYDLMDPTEPPSSLAPSANEVEVPIQREPMSPSSPSRRMGSKNFFHHDKQRQSTHKSRFSPAKRVKFVAVTTTASHQQKLSTEPNQPPTTTTATTTQKPINAKLTGISTRNPVSNQAPTLVKPSTLAAATAIITSCSAAAPTKDTHSLHAAGLPTRPYPVQIPQQPITATIQQPAILALIHSKKRFSCPQSSIRVPRKEKLRSLSELTMNKSRAKWH
ncbi:kinesin family member 10 [Pelomyxa schiedti]|nr:kinesin family member 10 [Pelomyxa schiedti]